MLTPDLAELMSAVAGLPGVTLGKALHQPGLMADGKLFAFPYHGGLVLKLPAARIDALIASHEAHRFERGQGRPMREWIVLPAASRIDWPALTREAYSFVSGRVAE
ncbi:MAG TPA: hypothetical protein VN042_03490 [Asticcacaulis sp.]|nr:hypothetical protein [Asticcacaulis sp.]